MLRSRKPTFFASTTILRLPAFHRQRSKLCGIGQLPHTAGMQEVAGLAVTMIVRLVSKTIHIAALPARPDVAITFFSACDPYLPRRWQRASRRSWWNQDTSKATSTVMLTGCPAPDVPHCRWRTAQSDDATER